MNRNRFVYFVAVCLTVTLGLASRRYAHSLPWWVAAYAGDTLWALMVFFGFGFRFTRLSSVKVSGLALIFSVLIELSQLSHVAWLESLRATRLGGLVLGYGFLWSDLVCYSTGILIGCLLEMLFSRVAATYYRKLFQTQ